MKLTRNWVIGLATMLAWVNLAASQERPKQPDMTTMGKQADKPGAPVAQLIGGPVQENPEKARKASPITYVDKESAPFLIMHGDQDNTVPLQQSEVLAEALRKAGVEVKIVVVKGNGHGGPGFTSPDNRRLIEDFFAKHLQRKVR